MVSKYHIMDNKNYIFNICNREQVGLYGILLPSGIKELKEKLYKKEICVESNPFIKNPACSHHNYTRDMNITHFNINECGSKNKFPSQLNTLNDTHIEKNIIENNNNIYLNGFKYKLLSSWDNTQKLKNVALCIESDGYPADICENCLESGWLRCNFYMDNPLYIAVGFTTSMGRSLFKYLIDKDDDFLIKEGFSDILAAKNLKTMFDRPVDKYFIWYYDHSCEC